MRLFCTDIAVALLRTGSRVKIVNITLTSVFNSNEIVGSSVG